MQMLVAPDKSKCHENEPLLQYYSLVNTRYDFTSAGNGYILVHVDSQDAGQVSRILVFSISAPAIT